MPPLHPTVRIPELNPLTTGLDLDLADKLPIYIASENKTKRVTLQQLNTFFALGGGGGGHPPVVNGAEMVYIVPPAADGLQDASIPSIAGEDFTIERDGTPLVALLPDLSNAADAEFEILSAGGFRLLQTGDVLVEDERFLLKLFNLVGGGTGGGGGSTTPTSFIRGKKVINTNITLDPVEDINKIIQSRAASDYITCTIPDIADIAANALMIFDTTINQSKPLTITTTGGQYIYFNGGSKTTIYMMPGEVCWIYRDTDGLYIINDFADHYKNIGNPLAAYKKGYNQVTFNGTEILRADYPRLWEEVQTFGSSLVTKAVWDTVSATVDGKTVLRPYRGCWHQGDGSLTFGAPDFLNSYVRGVKTESGSDALRHLNKPGGYQDAQVGEINDTIPTRVNFGSGLPYGLTDGSSGATTTIALNVGKENRTENIGVLWVCNS